MKKLAVLLVLVSAVFSADYQVGASLGFSSVNNSNINSYEYLNLRVGKYLPKNHIAKLELDIANTKVKHSHKNLTRILLNVEHYFDINEQVIPYAFVGIGHQWVDTSDSFVMDWGVGAKYSLQSNMDAFAELKEVRDFDHNDNHYGMLVGAAYKF